MTRDNDIILLFFNAFGVVVTYMIVNTVGFQVIPMIKIIKTFILLVSIIHLLMYWPKQIKFNFFYKYWVLIFLLLISIFWGENYFSALAKSATLFVPMVYLVLLSAKLVVKYGVEKTFYFSNILFAIIYSAPIIIYFLFSNSMEIVNLRTAKSDLVLTSNNFAWTSTILIILGFDIIRSNKPNKLLKYFLLLMMIPSSYLILIAGNRSSVMVLLVLLFFISIFRLVKLKWVILIVLGGFIAAYSLNISEFTTTTRVEKTIGNENLVEEEPRFLVNMIMVELFNQNPSNWISGIGLFDHSYIVNRFDLNGYHNSYTEILFGAGVFVFLYFLYLFVYVPFNTFFKGTYSYSFILIAVTIFPMFESDITGGQFLFYPWFYYVFLTSHIGKLKSEYNQIKAIGLINQEHRFLLSR